ncbi:aspartyl-phosphate phosphatase Spo0E family protein [Peribacillus aracenensis]|uniref:aspartyl-phosphate phosphatase Spo0E family protein n=1 Tax=Peribacillus aracenensis TaxID=2976708 RepID=UPI0037C78CBC
MNNRKEIRSLNLRNELNLKESIEAYRLIMYKLAKKNGLSDSHVIKISQQLDKKINMFQKNHVDSTFVKSKKLPS